MNREKVLILLSVIGSIATFAIMEELRRKNDLLIGDLRDAHDQLYTLRMEKKK